jgi:hypothetical protein
MPRPASVPLFMPQLVPVMLRQFGEKARNIGNV